MAGAGPGRWREKGTTPMDFALQVSRILHDEHVQALALLDRLQAMLARHPPAAAPRDGAAAALLRELAAAWSGEIINHFRFEEDHVFPVLAARGQGDIGELLSEEHRAIVATGERLIALGRAAAGAGFSPATWREFHRLAGALIAQLGDHARKEEMALLPLMEECLDAEADARLANCLALARH